MARTRTQCALTSLDTVLVNPEHMKGLTSVKVISRKYVLNERLSHACERILSPTVHYLTGLPRILLNKFGCVCTEGVGTLPGTLTDN